MEITLNELYKGFPCIIKNREFYSPKTYVEPFIERMSKFTDNFTVQIKLSDTLSTQKGDINQIYTRALIQAVLPEKYCIDKHDEVIGLVYGIDVRKPVVKLYRGYLNQACTNLCVFNPQWINVQDMVPGEPINYAPIKNLMEDTSNFAVNLQKMKDTYLDRNDRKNYLGEWVDYSLRESQDYGFGKVKIAVSTPIDAYKSLFIDSNSDYYIPDGYDPTLYDVYNAFTQIVTDNLDKDLLNTFEKTMIIGRLLKVIS